MFSCDSNWANLSVALGGYIYAIGGYRAGNNGPTERYDPVTNTWTRLTDADLGYRFYSGAVSLLKGQIWACGGNKRNGQCQILDTTTNTWIAAATMNQPRSVNSKSRPVQLHIVAPSSERASVWLR